MLGMPGPPQPVLDKEGKVIGFEPTAAPPQPVLDKEGKVIGFQPAPAAAPSSPGTPVVDAAGKVIGQIDASGQSTVPGTMTQPDGKIID
jgi:hypothetical protein